MALETARLFDMCGIGRWHLTGARVRQTTTIDESYVTVLLAALHINAAT
jgi:hypothetical protein